MKIEIYILYNVHGWKIIYSSEFLFELPTWLRLMFSTSTGFFIAFRSLAGDGWRYTNDYNQTKHVHVMIIPRK